MADYWKSQPKKFCQYCKCWIADNKPSVEFHERGKNHKENVAAKIAEIKKKSIDKAKQEDRMSKEFAAMEAAAQKAYEEDMKRLGLESGSQTPAPAPAPVQQPPPQPQPQRQEKTRKDKKSAGKSAGKAARPRESQCWVEAKSDDGVTYYYNTITGESGWERPEGFQEESSSSSAQSGYTEISGSMWMEAVSPDGYTYYYNTETGESSWERPADLPEKASSGASGEKEAQDKISPPQTQPPSGGEDSSNGAKGAKEGEAEGEDSQQARFPKFSFRKRKEEDGSKTDGRDEDDEDDGGDEDEDGGIEKVKGDEGDSGDKEAAPAEKIPAKKPRKTTPYGAWEHIQVEENPYQKVDLQLPQVEGGAAPSERPPQPKPKFRERTITSLGDQGGPTSFRKRKAENGKSRSLRQRGKDD